MASTTLVGPRKRGLKTNRLPQQQQLFVEHLVTDKSFNPSEAARAAGYKGRNAGHKLLTNKRVALAIGKAIRERMQRTEITSDRVLQELASIAFFNPKKMLDDDGCLVPLHELPDDIAACISSLEVEVREEEETDEEGNVVSVNEVKVLKFKFWNKVEALNLLMSHFGMLDERLKVEHRMDAGLTQVLGRLMDVVENEKKRSTMVIDGTFIESRATEGNGAPK